MTYRNHPTDMMGNPDGRDYHYRIHSNDEEAQKLLKFAGWKDRYIELYPSDMEHLRVKIGHKTFKTYDKMGYIKGMKKYAVSPKWEVVPHSRGKKEMKHAHGGGAKIKAEVHVGGDWHTVNVEYHVDATPGEIKDAFENGVEENAITREMADAQKWAVDDRLDELREAEREMQEKCDHEHTVKNNGPGAFAFCEDCGKEWLDEMEFQQVFMDGGLELVGSVA